MADPNESIDEETKQGPLTMQSRYKLQKLTRSKSSGESPTSDEISINLEDSITVRQKIRKTSSDSPIKRKSVSALSQKIPEEDRIIPRRKRSVSGPHEVEPKYIPAKKLPSPSSFRKKLKRSDKPNKAEKKKKKSASIIEGLPRSERLSRRKTFLKLLYKDKPADTPKDKASNTRQTLKRTSQIQSVINNLCIRPQIRDPQNNEEKQIFMSDVLQYFQKQRGARFCKSMSTIRQDFIDSVFKSQTDTSPDGGAPMGFGMMEIRIDRWWSEAKFSGKAVTSGVVFQAHPDTICEYIVALEQSSNALKQSKRESYVEQISGSLDISILENLTPISVFSDSNEVTYVTAGYSCTALVSSLGKVYIEAPENQFACCLGVSDCPQDWKGALYLDKILGRRIRVISCGASHFGAITDTNEIILWGVNTDSSTISQISGQLGNQRVRVSPPVLITGLIGIPRSVDCGIAHTVILTSEHVYTCGSNNFGQLGYETRAEHPKPVRGLKDKFNVKCVVSIIACGSFHTLVSTEDGLVFSWGNNSSGQLGIEISSSSFISTPSCVTNLRSIVTVSCGDSHSVALNDQGDVFTFGGNLFGQLGYDSSSNTWIPTIVHIDLIPNTFIVQISAGPFNTMALTNWGTGYSWGLLQSLNHLEHQFTPRLLYTPFIEDRFLVSISSGISHTVFLEDTELSNTLALLRSNSSLGFPASTKSLIQQIQRLQAPERTFGPLQERCFCAMISETGEEIPRLSIPQAYLQFHCSSLRRVYFKRITIHNPTDTRIAIGTIIPLNDAKYQLYVEPPTFRLYKRASREVTITLVATSKLKEPLHKLIHFVVKKRKSICYSDSVRLSTDNLYSQYLVTCALLPNTPISQEEQTPKSEQHGLTLIHSLTTYVPRILVEHFTKSPNAPREPNIQQFPAAILFLDISGFTSLNERLAQLGSNGAEVVSKHINSYFSQLIEVVSLHGGDVLKFAGDALICLWKGTQQPGSFDSLQQLTLRAVQCGLDIQNKLAKYDSQEGFSLTLHIGVGSGELLSLWVGSVDDSWEYLVSGEPLAQLRTAVDNSQAGQVVVSAPSWQLIKEYCNGESYLNDYWVRDIHSGVPPRPLPPLKDWPRVDAEPALRSFIPLAVQINVDSHHLAGWQNELRKVTVLFVKLNTPIPDDDKQEFLLTINSVLCCMQRAVFKYHGMIRQFLADDKGTVLIAAFGVPPFSHADDPIRGIKSSMEMHRELSELSMDCSIGITTGRVFCGSVGSQVRQEYAMVGDTVNLSARLMMAAYKQNLKILCDQTTFDIAQNDVNFDVLSPINVKGKKELIPIFSPSENMKENQFAIPKRFENLQRLTNRPEVLQFINDGILRVINPSITPKGTLLIEAGQGIGKSFVINEVIAQALEHDILVCHATAKHIESSQNLIVFQTILSDLLRITNVRESFETKNLSSISSDVISFLENLIDTTWLEMIPLLNDILPLQIKENETTIGIPASYRSDHLSSLLHHLISKVSEDIPLVLIMEDSQWLDNYSRTLVHTITCQCSRVFVICTARSSISGDVFSAFVNVPMEYRVKLEPLSPTESVRFVKTMLSVDDVPGKVVELLDKAQGNPLLLSEIIMSIQDANAVEIKEGKCLVIGDLQKIDFSRVTRILVDTLDSFSPVQQMVLKVASVIGFHFDLATIIQVFPTENTQKKFLKGELDVLVRLQVLFANCSLPGSEAYSFTNSSFLDVVHNRLTFDQKLQLHKELAKWYESKENIAYSAYHWTEVVDCIKNPSEEMISNSIKYLQLCGDRAENNKRPDAWKWRKKLYCVAQELPESSKLLKEIRLKTLGSSLFENEDANLKNILTTTKNSPEPHEIDLRFLCGVSGVHSPFG